MRFGFLLKRGKPEARELAAQLGRMLVAGGATLYRARRRTRPRSPARPP